MQLFEHRHASELQQLSKAAASQYTGIQCVQPGREANEEIPGGDAPDWPFF